MEMFSEFEYLILTGDSHLWTADVKMNSIIGVL